MTALVRFWTVVATLALTLAAASVVRAERPRRFIYNSDGNNMLLYAQPPMKPAELNEQVDAMVGTGVTTLFLSPNWGMMMSYPSEVAEMYGTLVTPEMAKKLEDPATTKKGSSERGLANLRALVAAGHDPIKLAVDRARAKNLEVFICFRLNEIHDVQNADSMIVSQFWRDHPEWHVGKIGDEVTAPFMEIIGGSPKRRVHPIVASWFPGALNFAFPEVRARRLAELRECCERFAIDGLDLDFQRFPIYFPQDEGHKHVETMTKWMREVRAMTREVGRKRGRPLMLAARVLARPRQCLATGLDPATWAKEGLVDFFTISHYLRNDFPLPVAEYRKMLPPELPVYASIEHEPKPDTYRKIARQLWADGADGIMLFNFFASRESGKEPLSALLHELGDPKKIRPVGE